MRGQCCTEKAGMGAHPYSGILGLNFAGQGCHSQKKQRRPIHRVHHDPSSRTGWPGEDRHDRRARQKRSTKAADCYLCAQRAMVGAAWPPYLGA